MYWDQLPASAHRPRMVALRLPSGPVQLETDAGVFARDGVDPGTKALLEVTPAPPDRGALLDLGCGYGPIAVSLAARAPHATVWAVDVNERALALVARNAERLGLGNVRAAAPAAVPSGLRFAALYSNPPVKIGKAPMRQLVLDWMDRLEPEAHAHLVVKRSMGSDSFAAWLVEQRYEVRRLASKRGYRILAVSRAHASVPAPAATPPSG
jgi:16S rRNA (guanine1207-N2)-methyltransferase